MTITQSNVVNRLLLRLSAPDFAIVEPQLEPVQLPRDFTLVEPDQQIEYVYFPGAGVTSVVTSANADAFVFALCADVPPAGDKHRDGSCLIDTRSATRALATHVR